MSRAVIRKVFVTGLVVSVVGGVFLLLSVGSGQPTNSEAHDSGLILGGIGMLIQVFSLLMAIVASAMNGRWGWFAVLLILGLLGLVTLVMIVYSVVGPSQRRTARRTKLAVT